MRLRFFVLILFLCLCYHSNSQGLDQLHQQTESSGISWELDYVLESFTSLDGGANSGSNFLGNILFNLELDLDQLVGIDRTAFSFNAINIHGSSLSGQVGDGLVLSSIDATPTTRFQNIWLQHHSVDSLFFIRIGKQAIDDEFMTTDISNLFVNSVAAYSFTLTPIAPQWPVASLGILGKYTLNKNWFLQSAIVGSDPRIADDVLNSNGLDFYFDPSGHLWIAEADYVNGSTHLKFGIKHDTNRFFDQFGVGKKGLSSVYSIVDFKILNSGENKEIGLFGMCAAGYSFQSDIAPFEYDLKGALVWKHRFGQGSNGILGMTYIYPKVGRANKFVIVDPISTEQILELTYLYERSSSISFQSDLQYIINPGGGIGSTFPNALVPGLRIYLSI